MDDSVAGHTLSPVADAVPLPADTLEAALERLRDVRIAVVGDFCLDIYWFVDPSRSETSLETGLATQPVREQRYSLGGAGNVVANLAAMGCGNIAAVGVVGDDPWGREMTRLLDGLGVDTSDLLVEANDWATLAYTKPHIRKDEANRIDFGTFNQLPAATAEGLLVRIEQRLPQTDVVIVNQQVRQGIHSPELRSGLDALMRSSQTPPFIVDSRHYSDVYTDAWLKINDSEAARLCGGTHEPDHPVLREEATDAAHRLFSRSNKPVFVTRGSRGIVVRDASGFQEIPGVLVLGRIDTVGAGDSALAGIAAGVAAGCDPTTAARIGNLVAAVTVQKLHQTGTATPDEILSIGRQGDYIYRPELAEDTRAARFLPGTDIEIVTNAPPCLRIRHALFDHDGTISVLRQGWETVMEPMMVRAILGQRYGSADEALYQRVVAAVRQYVDQSTGVRTLAQMQELVEMVHDFGCVPDRDILDAHGYKAIYNDALMGRVRSRLAKLHCGELAVSDFTIKNAVPFLERLRAAGVRMILASGTDQQDVIAEAEALGYAHLFEGGIYGAVDAIARDAKRLVLERIMTDLGDAATRELVAFGDGPVEIRETHKCGAFTVGIASDEIRRFGLSTEKRSRLIKAGADIIVPDFAQIEHLLPILGC